MDGINIGTNMNSNVDSKNNSFVKAILLTIVFGLIGCAIFYFVYNLGFIAYLGAYLIYYLAATGYKKGMGSIDKKGCWIVFLISFIELVLTLCLNIIVIIVMEFDVDFGTAVELFKYCIEDGNFLASIASDAIFSFVFLIISAVSFSRMEKRKKSSKTIVNDYTSNGNGVPYPYQGTNVNDYSNSQMTSSGTVVNDFSSNQNNSTQTTVNNMSNNNMNNQNLNYNDGYSQDNYMGDNPSEQSVEDLFKDLDDGTNNF